MSQNSNDFFSSFEGNAEPRKPKPPPPPRPVNRPTAAAPSPSYYGSSTSTSTSRSLRQPPPKPRTTMAQRPTTSYYGTATSAPSNAPAYSQNTFGANPIYNSNTGTTTPSYNTAATSYNTTTTTASTDYTDYSTSNTTTDTTTNPYNTSLSGSMETSVPNHSSIPAATPTYFTPTMVPTPMSSSSFGEDMENEPPLLEELGINLRHIFMKTKAVVIPFRRLAGNTALMDPSLIVEDADLAGPLVFALALGFELLLGLEVEFGAIYGFGLAGCVAMTLILNLMSPTQAVSFWTVTSILGYALLPVNLLAALKILLQNLAGFQTLVRLLAVLTILWCTTASTRLLEVGCGMAHQRYLIAYPISLLYTAFVLITIF